MPSSRAKAIVLCAVITALRLASITSTSTSAWASVPPERLRCSMPASMSTMVSSVSLSSASPSRLRTVAWPPQVQPAAASFTRKADITVTPEGVGNA